MRALFYTVFFLLAGAAPSLANIAQPGLWNAGGNGRFVPVFAEDSAAFRQIQMVREQVCVQVYPGFAVVKGSYWLWNTSEKPLRLKIGYPMNARDSRESTRGLVNFWVDSLASLQVRINGLSAPSPLLRPDDDIGQWYVWDLAFGPRDTALVEVFFIVDTNHASVLQGYDHKYPNGFVYLLESGATWRQPIREGWIGLQLMDGLDFGAVDGLAPDSVFGVNKMHKTIVRSFTDLSPTTDDNIVLTYGKSLEKFDFEAVVRRADALFAAVEAFSKSSPETWELTPQKFEDPFTVGGISWVGLIAVLIVAMPVLLVAVVVFLVLRFVRRRSRAKSNIDSLR